MTTSAIYSDTIRNAGNDISIKSQQIFQDKNKKDLLSGIAYMSNFGVNMKIELEKAKF